MNKQRTWLFTIYFFTLLGLVVSCSEQKTSLTQDFDRSGGAMPITVVVYPTIADMKIAYREHSGKPAHTDLQGWSTWTPSEPSECTIHTTKPKSIDDNVTMTWGHELVHCVYGNFHKN